jgi:hypothetical protein
VNRQRLADLMGRERFGPVGLSPAEHTEKLELQAAFRVPDDMPMKLVNEWASQRSLTRQQREIALLGMRWGPKPRPTGKQAVLETLALRWPQTAKQRELERMRARWT